MPKKWRPGSMGAADAKNEKLTLIVFSIVIGLIYLAFLLPIPGNFFHQYFKNTGTFWKILGFASVAVQYWVMWKKLRGWDSPAGARFTPGTVVLIFWTAVNVGILGAPFGL